MKEIKKLPLYIVMCVLLLGLLVMIIAKDRKVSDRENRSLAQFPKVSAGNLLDGKFMDDFETYLTDQFPGRDFCVGMKSQALKLAGFRRIGGVYLAEDDYLIAEEKEYKSADLRELIRNINAFAERQEGVNVNVMIVPNTIESLEDKLPYGRESTEGTTINLFRMNASDAVNLIDVREALSGDNAGKYYYKTDHHWTTRGAFAAFKEYEKQLGVSVNSKDYCFLKVTDSFQGTQSSNCGIYSYSDSIEICEPVNASGTYNVSYVNEERKETTLFDRSKLSEKDKYLVFTGGNYAEIRISTDVHNGKNLLIVKDSYANCMLPMFTGLYENIVVIDPRYYTNSLDTVIMVNGINEVLFLYNVNSIVEDRSLADVLKPLEGLEV